MREKCAPESKYFPPKISVNFSSSWSLWCSCYCVGVRNNCEKGKTYSILFKQNNWETVWFEIGISCIRTHKINCLVGKIIHAVYCFSGSWSTLMGNGINYVFIFVHQNPDLRLSLFLMIRTDWSVHFSRKQTIWNMTYQLLDIDILNVFFHANA